MRASVLDNAQDVAAWQREAASKAGIAGGASRKEGVIARVQGCQQIVWPTPDRVLDSLTNPRPSFAPTVSKDGVASLRRVVGFDDVQSFRKPTSGMVS
jgi:hypothetical protein